MAYLIEALPTMQEGSNRQQEVETAHKLLQQLVGCQVSVGHDAHGVPFIEGHPEVFVSISHCKKAVAVAISTDCPVGIDVECRRNVNVSLMERVCTPMEFGAIQTAADPVMLFLQYWTRKEAVLKCRHTGIKGFGSMVEASLATDCTVADIPCILPDVVAAIAHFKA